jgi:hypothetical protein
MVAITIAPALAATETTIVPAMAITIAPTTTTTTVEPRL